MGVHDDIKAAAKLPFPSKVSVSIKPGKKKLKIRPVKGRDFQRKSGR